MEQYGLVEDYFNDETRAAFLQLVNLMAIQESARQKYHQCEGPIKDQDKFILECIMNEDKFKQDLKICVDGLIVTISCA